MSEMKSEITALKVAAVGVFLVTALLIVKLVHTLPDNAKREIIRKLAPGISRDKEDLVIIELAKLGVMLGMLD